MRSGRSTPARLVLAFVVVGVTFASARAQQAAPGGPPASSAFAAGLEVTLTPYLWLPGIDAAIETPLRLAPLVSVGIGSPQFLGNLDAVPVTGAVELRDGPFSLMGDAIHVPVGAGITTHNASFAGGSAELNVNAGTALLFYHAFEEPDQSLDAGLGFRAWDFYSSLTLNGRGARPAMVAPTTSWADPLIGARYHRDLGKGLGLTAYADLGGFGVGAHSDWQVIGTLDYRPRPWVTLHLGYRSLNFDYSAAGGSLGFDVHMKGPILAASFRF